MAFPRCADCKHLRKRCPSDCIFSPYFPCNNPQRFARVHEIYGASNISKLLQGIPDDFKRAEAAAESIDYEAKCRKENLVYGCVGIITVLHQEIQKAQCQLAKTQAQIAFFRTLLTQEE